MERMDYLCVVQRIFYSIQFIPTRKDTIDRATFSKMKNGYDGAGKRLMRMEDDDRQERLGFVAKLHTHFLIFTRSESKQVTACSFFFLPSSNKNITKRRKRVRMKNVDQSEMAGAGPSPNPLPRGNRLE